MKASLSTQLRTLYPLLAAAAAASALTGCESAPKRPMTTSISDLHSETRRTSGGVFEHHEVLSVAGLLPMTETGVFFHYPPRSGWIKRMVTGQSRDRSPITALGISTVNTFRLVGTSSNTPTHSDLVQVRNSLMDLQASVVRSTQLARNLLALRDESSKLDQSANKTETNTLNGRQAFEKLTLQKGEVDKQISEAEKKFEAASAEFRLGLLAFRTATSVPGLMLAHWTVEKSSSGSVGVSKLASFSHQSGKGQSGLVILGGIRVSALFPGDDFYDLFINLSRVNRDSFALSGLTTYVLQAKNLLSISELNVTEAIAATAKLKKEYFTGGAAILAELEEIQLEYQAVVAANLNNLTAIGPMKWVKDEVRITDTKTLPWLDAVQPPDNQEWRTLHAVVTFAPKVYKAWERILDKTPEAVIPVMALYETSTNLNPSVKTECRKLDESLSELRTHLVHDRSYLFNERLQDAMTVLGRHIVALNRHITFGSDSDVITHLAAALTKSVATINAALAEDSWGGIRQSGPEERKILLAVAQADASFRQFPPPADRMASPTESARGKSRSDTSTAPSATHRHSAETSHSRFLR